ncbi:hypothetical protein LXL04_005839 [Taraxacum kok-saghyz]
MLVIVTLVPYQPITDDLLSVGHPPTDGHLPRCLSSYLLYINLLYFSFFYLHQGRGYQCEATFTINIKHVIGRKRPTTSDSTEWTRRDAIVNSWVYNTLSWSLLHMVFEKKASTYTIWSTIEKVFRDNKAQRIIQIDNELRNITIGDFRGGRGSGINNHGGCSGCSGGRNYYLGGQQQYGSGGCQYQQPQRPSSAPSTRSFGRYYTQSMFHVVVHQQTVASFQTHLSHLQVQRSRPSTTDDSSVF